MRIYSPIVILSAYRSELTEEQNAQRTAKLESSLESLGFNFKQVVGCYGGSVEQSFVVASSDIKTLLALSAQFDQECIMFSDKHRQCKLVYPNGKELSIGKLKPIEAGDRGDNFTYCPELDQYYRAS